MGTSVTAYSKFRKVEGGITIFGDNKGALDLAKTTKHHDRTKHIAIRFHFLCEHVKKGTVVFVHVPTTHMWADILTKPLGLIQFKACRHGLGMGDILEEVGLV
jgi:hypothetical protein